MPSHESIWRDTYYTTSASPFVYSINTISGDTVFAGKAYRMPNGDDARINVNKICENYLHQTFEPWFEDYPDSWVAPDALRYFELKDNSGNTLVEYGFLNNWDYDFLWTGTIGANLSDPICDDYANGMIIFNSVVGYVDSSRMGVYNYATYVSAGTLECADYALYYVNARGGLDSFAIQGATLKKDNIKAYTTDRAFNNNTPEFETIRNISEINTSYELNTHYLTDEQAAKVAKHLIGSNLVYLHCLKDGTIKPVIVKDTQAVYQTYQTNGGKMAQYKITVEESQTKRRRR